MVNGVTFVDTGKKLLINRGYKATPDYTIPSQFKVGISNGTPNIGNTNLDVAIPIDNGTVNDDGSNNFTGSDGGDNSTNNTTTFKPGAGLSDVTSQNLIANNTSVSKTWTSPDLAVAGADLVGTQPLGFWIYIKDATALAKFLTSGTAIESRVRTNGDAANAYYSKTWAVSTVAVGWNWLTSNTVNVEDLTQGAGGAPSGALDRFVIIITTNNATDTFVVGDVLYDLLRQWAESDLVKNFTQAITIDEVNFEITKKSTLSTLEANGFDINGFADFNSDTTKLMQIESTFTAESKANTDQIIFTTKERFV